MKFLLWGKYESTYIFASIFHLDKCMRTIFLSRYKHVIDRFFLPWIIIHKTVYYLTWKIYFLSRLNTAHVIIFHCGFSHLTLFRLDQYCHCSRVQGISDLFDKFLSRKKWNINIIIEFELFVRLKRSTNRIAEGN